MNEKLANWRWALGVLLLSGALGTGVFGLSTSQVWADREHDDDEAGAWRGWAAAGASESSPAARRYVEECGSCHLAYPAGLLPAASWRALMNGLADHFGDNAELLPEDQQAIETYLLARAADRGAYRNRRFAAGVRDGAVPLRITELPYFRNEHDEINPRWVAQNPEVGGFSQCDRCHQTAAEGRFDEDYVAIPGYGRWDD
ncbi:diheme cytochrome c [Motiliproteus sp. SC1-56]|uniref:diheme cytochrome c n=1 Tax=Motiliproteus sp. SC1-56 TaxID=2799565 RepID=UPI001A8D0B57|nr:diheme cytochrome c [Motiliproteus sp. SC1-56]